MCREHDNFVWNGANVEAKDNCQKRGTLKRIRDIGLGIPVFSGRQRKWCSEISATKKGIAAHVYRGSQSARSKTAPERETVPGECDLEGARLPV
jgi:hypothetical protein